MSMLRVVVADDSLTVRKRIVEILHSDPGIKVVGEAADGREAVELCQRLRPDVMTLDMMMPVMTGLAATEYIMAHFPTPILIVSASINRGEVFRTYDALAAGALDVLDKSKATASDSRWELKLIATVKLIARIRVITHPRGKRELPSASIRIAAGSRTWPSISTSRPEHQLVAIGTSTGGPNAIREILSHLSADFPLPVLFVIHIGASFGNSFAEWLNQNSVLPVAMARDGQAVPAPGDARVLMAPPDWHLIVENRRLRLLKTPDRHSCRPSVDVLFESVAREYGTRAIGCLLTGMGRDGASGLLAMRGAGALTFAQDEVSSVVFGMPKEAILLGAAQEILAVQEIGPRLSTILLGRGQRRLG
jgi:two-component system, chemotaxis family, protein-glutamate methylesterase/glutaminase